MIPLAVKMRDDSISSAASASAGAGFPAAAGSHLERVSCCLCGSDDAKVLFQAADKMFTERRETFRTVRCRNCGCVTHWEPLDPQAHGKLGVNIRNFEPDALGPFRIRRFDGAESWTFLD